MGKNKKTEIYSVSFQTRRLGTIATGFTLRLAGSSKNMPIPIKKARGAMKTGVGFELNRDYEAVTEFYSDPLFAALDRLVFITHLAIPKASGMTVIKEEELMDIFYKSFIKGDIQYFLDKFLVSSGFVQIIYKSWARKGSSPPPAEYTKSFAQATRLPAIGNIVSTMDIVSTYLPIFGAEIYWDHGNTYQVEIPRTMTPTIEPVGYISREKIISQSYREDIYNIPDIVIPKFDSQNVIGKEQVEIFLSTVTKALTAAMKAGVNTPHGPNFKISTFEVPQIVVDGFMTGKLVEEGQKDFTTGVLRTRFKEVNDSLTAFYESLAVSSAMYQIQSGTIRIIYDPEISTPAAWYDIDGKKFFVSDISHETSRFRRETILTIVMSEDLQKKLIAKFNAVQDLYRANLKPVDMNDKAKNLGESKIPAKDSEALSKRKKAMDKKLFNPCRGEHRLRYNGGYKDMKKFLPSRKDAKQDIKGTVASKRIPAN